MPEGKGGSSQGGGTGRSRGSGSPSKGQGRGQRGGRPGAGGTCVCPQCGEQLPHEMGRPCFEMMCPKCGTAMARNR